MSEAVLFKKCLGLNDTVAFASQKMLTDPRDEHAGEAELIDSLNLTTTPDGCLEKIPKFTTVLTHSAPITSLSSGERLIFQDAVDTREWDGTNNIQLMPLVGGSVCHTNIDVRVSNSNSKIYKSLNSAPTMQEALIGSLTAIPPTSKTFAKMPPYAQAFVYNAKMYAVNAADPRFLQHSEDYLYDVYNLADNFYGHVDPIINAGAIYSEKPGDSGCILCMHNEGVTLYDGSGPSDFTTKFYSCHPYKETMFSGFISKAYGYGHIFLCADGIFFIDPSGNVTNLTLNTLQHIDTLNDSYYDAVVQEGKYLAFGNKVCIEYDFRTKTALKREPFACVGATTWNNVNYFATGNTLVTPSTQPDTDSYAMMVLPFNNLGAQGAKIFDAFYFTGIIEGEVLITVSDNASNTGDPVEAWSVPISSVGRVSRMRMKTPRVRTGNHVSIKIECFSGQFRIEELRASFVGSQRSR